MAQSALAPPRSFAQIPRILARLWNVSHTIDAPVTHSPLPILALRGAIGGLLMGLANLVPGISGGTMLLAAGVYTSFIRAIAEVTTLRFRADSLAILGSVVVAAVLAILLLAGTIKTLVVEQRWIMYSIFIGLTLGGIPVIWKLVRPARSGTWVGAAIGFAGMAGLALAQAQGTGAAGNGASGPFLLFLAGLAGASAMILPGVSGGYLLLVLGQYVPILSAIDRFKVALGAGDTEAVVQIGLTVVLPVGLGVVAGIVGVSNLLRFLLRRYEKVTLGVLLGLLVGAIVGLWPFQQGVAPEIGDVVKGQVVTAETLATLDAEDWPTKFFGPANSQMMTSLGLILAGFLATSMISKIRGDEPD
jgi:putative membrane protein